jgi:trk system potassium uptake protein TrkH
MLRKKASPYIIIILGFAAVILFGTILLLLPFATVPTYHLSFIDAFFTSTSAVCVTGLLSIPAVTGYYTLFGKIVILALIEVGGLGFVTVAIFIFSLLGVKIGMKDRFLIKESMNQNSLRGMVKLVKVTVMITLIIQVIGAIINFIVFRQDYSAWDAIGISIFHSISAFNNAGFDVLGSDSLRVNHYDQNLLLNLNTTALIILGGIGFIVIYDVFKKRSWKKLSIHTKIVLQTTLALIIVGTVLIKLFENDKITWLQAYFNSVSSRTAGFQTVDYNDFSNAALYVVMILMYIGASPASTAGGIKTTTFYTVLKYIVSFARGKQPITHKRRIADSSVDKAMVLVVFSIVWIVIAILMINLVERLYGNVLIDQYKYGTQIVFEVFSAFGTVGNMMGITVHLHPLSKFILCLTMFFGRLGPITIMSALNRRWNVDAEKEDIRYIEEQIIIG